MRKFLWYPVWLLHNHAGISWTDKKAGKLINLVKTRGNAEYFPQTFQYSPHNILYEFIHIALPFTQFGQKHINKNLIPSVTLQLYENGFALTSVALPTHTKSWTRQVDCTLKLFVWARWRCDAALVRANFMLP